jgi:hypothetical protein
MSQLQQELPELAAARIAGVVLERKENDRLETAFALLAWCVTLLRDADAETRTKLGRAMFAHAVWLAPTDTFDDTAIRIVREQYAHSAKDNATWR